MQFHPHQNNKYPKQKKPSRTEGFNIQKMKKGGDYLTISLDTAPSEVFTKYKPLLKAEVSNV
jgi:hypothetical protein